MARHLQVGGIEIRLEISGSCHCRCRVVRNRRPRNSTQVLVSEDVSPDPARQVLRGQSHGKEIVAGAEHDHEEFRLSHLSGLGIRDRDADTGETDEQLVSDTVLLSHDHVELFLEAIVVLIKLAVLESCLLMVLFVLLSQENQNHIFAVRFPVDVFEVRHEAPVVRWRRRKIQLGFERGVIQGRVLPPVNFRVISPV